MTKKPKETAPHKEKKMQTHFSNVQAKTQSFDVETIIVKTNWHVCIGDVLPTLSSLQYAVYARYITYSKYIVYSRYVLFVQDYS